MSIDPMKWQPIETAPKDETRVLLSGYEYNNIFVGKRWVTWGWWRSGRNIWLEDSGNELYPPTHWMPRPPPPID